MSSIFLKVCSNIIYLCFYQFVKLSFLSVRWQKMALLVLLKGRLVGGAKPNVPFVRWQFKIFCAVGKKLKHRRVGNECRLTPCPFVVSFLCLCSPVKMVYFFCFSVRYFLSGRCLLRLHTTVSGFAFGRVSEYKTVNQHYT